MAEIAPMPYVFPAETRFEPVPGLYRPTVFGSDEGPLFLCYGMASAFTQRQNVVAVVLQLDDYEPSVGERPWGPGLDRRAQFMARDEWNEMAFERVGEIAEGLRDLNEE